MKNAKIIIFILLLTQQIMAQEIEYVNSLLWAEVNDVEVVENYAFCVMTNGLVVLDLTDLAEPEVISNHYLPGEGNEIDLVGNYSYVADGSMGLYILDVSDPYNPTLSGTCTTPGPASDVKVLNNYAYVADVDSGLQIIEVSDPNNPSIVGQYVTYGADKLDVINSYAFITHGYSLKIVNVSEPTNPFLVGYYGCASNTRDISVNDYYAYLIVSISEYAQAGLHVIDISDPSEPDLDGFCQLDNPWGVLVSGNYVFVGDGGLEIINVSNPSNPFLIAETSFGGNEIYKQDDYLYMTDEILSIIDISDLGNPELAGIYNPEAGAHDICVLGNRIYSVSISIENNSMNIVDITNPSSPTWLGKYNAQHIPRNVCVSNDYAYVSLRRGDLHVVDVSDPVNPNCIDSISLTYPTREIYISDDVTFILTYSHLQIFDTSDPYNLELYSSYSTSAYSIFVKDNYAFLGNGWSGLEIVDVSDLENPILAGSYDTPGLAKDVFVQNNHAFLCDDGEGLQIFDVSDPSDPALISNYDDFSSLNSVCVSGDYAYLIYDHLIVLNISDISNPYMVDSYELQRYANEVVVDSEYVYVAAGSALLVFHFDPHTGIEHIDNIPWRYGLFPNYPNPFNTSTTISYILPHSSDVTLDIYDILGRKVQKLYNGNQPAGSYSVIWNADGFSSGIYFYKLTAGEYKHTQKMMLMK